nr:fimbria/pilus periplasmic chaperone [Pantoea agglomerans]
MRVTDNFIGKLLTLAVILCVPRTEAGVALGATRIIYPSEQKQVTLGVINSFDKDTFLIHSWAENNAGQKDSRFVITPPLFLMHGKKENTLRIIDATNNSLPKDRESLFWINVRSIPSLDKDKLKENTLQLSITSRIKLFYRPKNLYMPPEKAPANLTFRHDNNALVLNNPTPYFLTVTEIKVGAFELSNAMVPPMGFATIEMPKDAGKIISYRTINDFGALTETMKKSIQ